MSPNLPLQPSQCKHIPSSDTINRLQIPPHHNIQCINLRFHNMIRIPRVFRSKCLVILRQYTVQRRSNTQLSRIQPRKPKNNSPLIPLSLLLLHTSLHTQSLPVPIPIPIPILVPIFRPNIHPLQPLLQHPQLPPPLPHLLSTHRLPLLLRQLPFLNRKHLTHIRNNIRILSIPTPIQILLQLILRLHLPLSLCLFLSFLLELLPRHDQIRIQHLRHPDSLGLRRRRYNIYNSLYSTRR